MNLNFPLFPHKPEHLQYVNYILEQTAAVNCELLCVFQNFLKWFY